MEREVPNIHFSSERRVHIFYLRQEDVELHSHNHLELVYVMRGTARHTLDDQQMRVREGDFFFIDYNAYHKYDTKADSHFEIVNVLFRPELIDASLSGCRSFRELLTSYLIRFQLSALEYSPANTIYHDHTGTVRPLFDKMLSEYEARRPGYVELIRCTLIEVIIEALRTITRQPDAQAYGSYGRTITAYIDEHYMEDVTLGPLCGQFHVSLPYLSRRFREDVGMTFRQYLQHKRLEEACRLLANTDKKVADIAELVGYGDTKFFNEIFRRELNLSPRAFRKQAMGK